LEKSIPGRGESHELPTVTTVITEITIFPLLWPWTKHLTLCWSRGTDPCDRCTLEPIR